MMRGGESEERRAQRYNNEQQPTIVAEPATAL